MKPLEKEIESEFCRCARALGWTAVKFSDPARRGAPDRMVLTGAGVVFFVEFKRPGERLRREQKAYHERLRDGGYAVHVCDCSARAGTIIQIEEARARKIRELETEAWG